jgi:hypothetical protein
MKLMNHRMLRYALLVAIILMTLSKLTLMGSGFFAFHDEFRYLEAGKALQNLTDFEFQSSAKSLFSATGRPGEVLVKTLPTALQVASAKILGLEVYEPSNSLPLFAFNFVIYGFILLFLYKLSFSLLKNRNLSLLSLLIYSSLTNSHIYLRHALPYDTSLLLFLIILHRIVVHTEEERSDFLPIFYLGFLGFFSYLVYPGYILLYLTTASLLFFYKIDANNYKAKSLMITSYFLGSVTCLTAFEALSRFAGTSYLRTALRISSKITEGAFNETLVFMLKYLTQVESAMGFLLILGILLTTIVVTKRFAARQYRSHELPILLFLSLTSLYLAYAGSGYFFQKVVLYGRLLHQFVPFLCIYFVYAIHSMLRSPALKNATILTASLIAVVNYAVSLAEYLTYTYPRDIASELIQGNPSAAFEFPCEYENNWSALKRITSKEADILKSSEEFTDSQRNKLIIVNNCFFHPVDDPSKYHPYEPTSTQNLIRSEKHFMSFKAYQFEGYRPVERDLVDKLGLKIKIYSE